MGKCKVWSILCLKAVADLCVKLACSLLDLLCTLSSGLELKQANIRFVLDLCWYEEDKIIGHLGHWKLSHVLLD